MSEDQLAWAVILGISVAAAVVTHSLSRRLFLASLLAAVAATIVFQIINYVQLGYLDPFVIVAVPVGLAMSFILALGVGAVMRRLRRPRP
jgi:uncharacterized membrane protein YccC